jgi:hypothetical protein
MNTLEPKSTALVFERQRRESSKAFAAFQAYLELGEERSHALVAKQIGISRRMIHKWSKKYGWMERIAGRDAYLAEVERMAIERVAVEKAVEWWKVHEPTRREAWLEAERTIAMVRKARERWEESGRTPGFEGMARLLELAFKLKQFAAGMPSEIKETHTLVTGKVSVEWEAAIRKAYGVVEVGKAETLKAETLKLGNGPGERPPEREESVVDVEASQGVERESVGKEEVKP